MEDGKRRWENDDLLYISKYFWSDGYYGYAYNTYPLLVPQPKLVLDLCVDNSK